MIDTVELKPAHLQIIHTILNAHLHPDVRVWVFGSRAKHSATNASDLDLALEEESEIPDVIMAALEYAFEESSLPYRVDVVDLNQSSDSFRDMINSQKVALPEHAGTNNR